MTADARAVESLLAFWADAGVTQTDADAPVDRTAETVQAMQAKAVQRQVTPLRPAAAATAAPRPALPAAAPEPVVDISEARRLAAGAESLEALEAAIAAFDGCPLKTAGGATRSVFARGNPQAPLFVIGEGPGQTEDREGKPFVGRAGQLLDRMLAAAGLEDRVFISNTVFWRPPGNRDPAPSEQAACAPFLERAIELVAPRLILVLGAPATKFVLRQQGGILSLRGRWFEWRSEDETRVIPALPTLHPAFLLRQPSAKKKAWEDLLTLTDRLDRPERPA
ncbi:MAG: uracil-DNA glycosylase [Caulobacteraceae bacterium]